jgi:hypothetical protein
MARLFLGGPLLFVFGLYHFREWERDVRDWLSLCRRFWAEWLCARSDEHFAERILEAFSIGLAGDNRGGQWIHRGHSITLESELLISSNRDILI